MDEVIFSEKSSNLNESADGVLTMSNSLDGYDIKKEVEEIQFDLHHSIEIKEEISDVQVQPQNMEYETQMPRKAVRINKALCRKRATLEQMSSLLDFIQNNKNVRLGTGSADVLRADWNALARQVNGVGGAVKTGKRWKKAYIEWKSHVRMKLRKGEPLSKLNKRCAELAVDFSRPAVKKLERKNKSKIVKSFPKKATSKQMSSLLQFIQQNEYLRSGLGTADVQKAGWDALSRQVNALGAATKTPEGWRKAYFKWKSHVRIKLRKGEPLSQQDKACVHLAGPSITDRCRSTVKELGVPDKHENRSTFRARKATPDQMSSLLDFIQENENFRVGKRNAGGSQADWEALTRQLNAVRGTTKTVKGWKKTHTEWRSHVRTKLKQGKALSKLDKRCANVMGLNTVDTNKSTGRVLRVQERKENKEKIEKTSRAKKASSDQFSSLLDFIQENENIRLGKGNADDLTAGWETLTLQLNSLEGSTKTAEGWRKTYTEWKSHVRMKFKKGETLSEQDKRCAHLMGLDTVNPYKSTESALEQENQEKIERTSGAKRATSEQLSSFLDFIQENENFRVGKGNADDLTAGWEALTLQLNALDGCIKTTEGWKKSYTEWKSHIRIKLRKGATLSELDERCMRLTGLDKADRGKSAVKDLAPLDDQKNKKKPQKTPRAKRATSQQMWSLLDYIQQNDKFRLGKGSASDLKASWEALTQQLNALGGTVKTVEGWRKAYTEWKSHVRMKLRKGETLSVQDKRCAYLEGLKLPTELDTVDCDNSIEKEFDFPCKKKKMKSKRQVQRIFRNKKATSAQMISLLEFIQENENFCIGKGTVADLKANWEDLTLQLNTLGGSTKTVEGWKRTYTEWRSSVRSRLRRRDPLSKLDRRYVYLARFNTVALGKLSMREPDNSDERGNAEEIAKTSRSKRSTTEHLSTILDFIQQNDNFRLGEGTADDIKTYWEALTLQLNNLGGTIKTVDGWKKAYSEWKSHIRIKLKKGVALSEQDKRCVHLAGLNRIDRGKLRTKGFSEEQANREKASRNKRATADQMSSLLDFIEENENIRVGKGNGDDLKAGWEALTRHLNSVGGATKTVEGWKKTHTEWKSHVRRKVRRGEPLSKLDRRCAHLAGLKAVAFGKSTVQELGNPNQRGNREKIVIKSRAKRATSEHMTTILDFIQQNDNFRLCKGTAYDLRVGWETLTLQLNSLGGTTKTAEGWKKAYIEWKSHVRMKLRRGMTLSRLDKRCAHLAGLNVVTISETTGKELSFSDEQEKIARTSSGKRATSEQMSSLLDFIQQNDNFRLGNGSVDDLNSGWESLTRQLNDVRGTTKTVEGWKKAYTEWKSHVRIRLRKGEKLSNQDKRLAHLAELNRIDLDKSIVKELDFLTKLGNGEIIEKIYRAKKATSDQMSSLLDFIEQNEYIRLGIGTSDDLKVGWETLTQELNAVGGATKTVEGWKKTYTEWKSHVRMKLRKGEILSEQDKRCAHLTGLDTIARNMSTVGKLDFSYEQHNGGLDEGKPGNSEGDEGKNETIGIKYFKDLIDLRNVEIVQELNENTSEPSSSVAQVFLPDVITKRRPS